MNLGYLQLAVKFKLIYYQKLKNKSFFVIILHYDKYFLLNLVLNWNYAILEDKYFYMKKVSFYI